LQVVDEAVFARRKSRPGFPISFFYLDRKVMSTRYEIHSIGMPEIARPVEESGRRSGTGGARAVSQGNRQRKQG